MKYYKYLIFLTLFIHVHSTPLFENQIATFIRDFILSGGSSDQDDDSTDFAIQETLSNEDDEDTPSSLTESNILKDNGKKVLVFYKDEADDAEDNQVIKRRGKRTVDVKKPKKKLTRQQVRAVLTQLRSNLQGRPINMRTILDGLQEVEGGDQIGELLSNSVLAAIREFFSQLMSSIM